MKHNERPHVMVMVHRVRFASVIALALALSAACRSVGPDYETPEATVPDAWHAEAGETLAVFAAMCLFPSFFPALAFIFAAVVFWTALARVLAARRDFR